jgi:predicted nucleic acid-binding Zn finger protein
MLAPVCDVPTERQAEFTMELLSLNHTLYGVGFTVYGGKSYIKAIRELEGLDKSEVRSTFDRVGIYADDYDDVLKAKYFPVSGGRG